jgi:hypothetical protein
MANNLYGSGKSDPSLRLIDLCLYRESDLEEFLSKNPPFGETTRFIDSRGHYHLLFRPASFVPPLPTEISKKGRKIGYFKWATAEMMILAAKLGERN